MKIIDRVIGLLKELLNRIDIFGYAAAALALIIAITSLITDVLGITTMTASSRLILSIILGLVALTSLTAVTTYLRTTTQHPRSLSISLVGPPGAGKTVYLTMLFRELEAKEVRGLNFAPYGTRTVEEVANNLSILKKGRFPAPTVPGSHFRYEALASYGSQVFSRRYRIQITDFAGEHLDEFDTTNEKWLHRSDFFEYVMASDALIIMVDCDRLLNKTDSKHDLFPDLENNLVATLYTFIERRSSDPSKLFDIPVGLILSKSDLLKSPKDEAFALSQLSRLISVCQKRCRYFRYFFLSSLGKSPIHNDDGIPMVPLSIKPIGIVEPLLWILGK